MTLRSVFALIAAMLCSGSPWAARAQTAGVEPPSGLEASLEQEVRQLALIGASAGTAAATAAAATTSDTAAAPGVPSGESSATALPRVEVSVGQLDTRLRLAPCQRIEPYVPEGARMWGRSRVGLRCVQGATKWSVYLPVTVRVFGRALVATSSLAAGSVLTAADLASAEVDLAEDGAPPIARAEFVVGRTLSRALKPGQSLRQSHLKPRQWFAAGETVTVVAEGDGFRVVGEAQALSHGIEGQPVRLRTEGGRMLSGLAVGEHRVALGL